MEYINITLLTLLLSFGTNRNLLPTCYNYLVDLKSVSSYLETVRGVVSFYHHIHGNIFSFEYYTNLIQNFGRYVQIQWYVLKKAQINLRYVCTKNRSVGFLYKMKSNECGQV